MANLKGTKTEQNLKEAYTFESLARNMYTYHASQAKKEGLFALRGLLEQASDLECVHAKIWYKLLHNGVPQTEENLLSAIAEEKKVCDEMYRKYAEEAKEEGFPEIADTFLKVAEADRVQQLRWEKILQKLREGRTVATKPFEAGQRWICINCGYVYQGETVPAMCPMCDHPTRMGFCFSPFVEE